MFPYLNTKSKKLRIFVKFFTWVLSKNAYATYIINVLSNLRNQRKQKSLKKLKKTKKIEDARRKEHATGIEQLSK